MKCAGRVGYGNWGRTRQCTRKATDEDGFCYQHHPEAIQKRHSETAARHRKAMEQRTRPFERLDELRNLLIEIKKANYIISFDLATRIGGAIDG